MNSILMTGTATCWDAGEAGCGLLILGVKRQLERIQAGEMLHVIARDPASHIDLDHWCRITGHSLVSASRPNYVLRKKD